MTTDNQYTGNTDIKPIPFGVQLKTAREAMGLTTLQAAEQLRLNEKVILMLEKERYPADLPVTFIRGYIRSYGKLLQLSEHQIKKGLEPIKAKPALHDQARNPLQPLEPVTSSNYFMQFFTYLIVLTLVGLVGSWWYSHNNIPPLAIADNTTAGTPLAISPEIANEAPVPAAKEAPLQVADNTLTKPNAAIIPKKAVIAANKDNDDNNNDDNEDDNKQSQNQKDDNNQQNDNGDDAD